MIPRKLLRAFSSLPHKQILLSIEGNIGAGKTTFLRLMKERIQVPFEVIPEPVADWQRFANGKIDLLELFYKEPKKYAYIFQSYCFFSRLKNWTMNQNCYTAPILIFERSIYSDKHIFAISAHNNGFFNEVEWEMYNEWYDFLVKHLAKQANGFIYLQTTPKMCLQRTQKRARHGEEGIALEYLNKINDLHEAWLSEEEKTNEIKILRLNTDEEFEENEINKEKILSATMDYLNNLMQGSKDKNFPN